MVTDPIVAAAMQDLMRACKQEGASWALIGGQALIAHGIPRMTEDADGLVDASRLGDVAQTLVEIFGWTPLLYDERSRDYEDAKEVVTHFMDDPVLFDVGQERSMIPLRSTMGLLVELLAAQHPVEIDMIDEAEILLHHGAKIPIAPLGGVLLVKAKADRGKDTSAIEQAAEHLKADELRGALAWAEDRDPATTEDLRAIMNATRIRRSPKRTSVYAHKPRSR